MLFALSLPVLTAASLGALDLTSALRGQTYLQGVADAAALQGATELGFDQSSATAERTQAFAASQAQALGATWATMATASADFTGGKMTVTLNAVHGSFFGNLIKPDGWRIHVTSTAIMNARRPLCVLATAQAKNNVVHVQDTSTLTSPACLVQSNSDLTVDPSAQVTAGDVRVVSSAQGSITPAPLTNVPQVEDPFDKLPITIPTTCTDSDKLKFSMGTQSLNPGTHCGDVKLSGTATLILNPGEHYFTKGNVHMTGSSQLLGTDVALIFKANYNLKFDQNASMSLEGRKSGPYAGFVMITDRAYNNNFTIETDQARKILGTIYLPNATLQVSGDHNKVGDQSPWTVIVAKAIQLQGSANLVVNASYSTTAVPVPTGVGNSARSVRLSN